MGVSEKCFDGFTGTFGVGFDGGGRFYSDVGLAGESGIVVFVAGIFGDWIALCTEYLYEVVFFVLFGNKSATSTSYAAGVVSEGSGGFGAR